MTVNEQLSDPHVLEALALTVVVPTGKKDPEAGEYVIVGAGLPVALAAKLTVLPQESTPLLTVILAGQVITGAVFTVKVATFEVADPQRFVKTARY